MIETAGQLVAVFLGLTVLWFFLGVLTGEPQQRHSRPRSGPVGRLSRH